jgi:hypothetical protein
MSDLVGGCLCGKIRYDSKAAPVMTAICHCKNCQKQAGSAFSVIVAVPKSALSVTGTLKTFNDTGSSGKPVRRNFCPDCGSPITTDVEAMPDLVFIKAGTLDDTSSLAPTMEIFCSSTQPWTTRGVQMQKFAQAPG